MSTGLPNGVAISAPITPEYAQILTSDALAFVAKLHRAFEPRRQELLARRVARQQEFDAGRRPDFLTETREIRQGAWTIAPLPADLQCRRVEITGPVERKMIINALNSGADSYMADFEDSNTPTWANQIEGHSKRLEVSRPSLREALPKLETRGLLRAGRGGSLALTDVSGPTAPAGSSYVSKGNHPPERKVRAPAGNDID